MVQLATADAPTFMGRYEIVATLASGGMAEIFLARLEGALGFERPVVVKRILPQLARTRSYRDMFVDEARIVAGIRHPNVVQVHELGEHGAELFLVMEYLDGETVGSLMRRLWSQGSTLDRDLAAYIVAEACAGLHAAHELTDPSGAPRNLVHRDVSPHNLFITYDGCVKVLDFGVAQASERITKTETGQVKGKFEYMSPEQCQSRPLDRRADVFALGIILYELTTARRLFKRPSLPKTLDAVCRQPIALPSQLDPAYPKRLEAVCLRALARRAAERQASAIELRRELLGTDAGADGGRLPEERLAALMREVFADRLAAKREMLRHCAAGSRVTSVVEAEADPDVEIPIVDEETALQSSAEAAPTRRGGRGWKLAALGAAAAAGLLAVFAIRPAAPVAALTGLARSVRLVAVASPKAGSAPTTEPSAAPAPSEISLEVVTNPPGAEIRLDGALRGRSPATFRFPRANRPIALEVRRTGFAPIRQTVSPDVDQRLVLDLKAQAAHASRPRPAAPDPNGGHEVFE